MGKISRLANSRPPKDTWEDQLYMSVTKDLWNEMIKPNNNCMYLFPNIARWNDWAAKEAFDHARTRFLARIKNVPCDVASPDPEAYLDKVNWSEDYVVPEMDKMSVWSGEGEFGVEGFEVMTDPSFSVGWGPDEWYETKEEEKDFDVITKSWQTKAVKVSVGGGGRRGYGGGVNYSSSSRGCTWRNRGGGYSSYVAKENQSRS